MKVSSLEVSSRMPPGKSETKDNCRQTKGVVVTQTFNTSQNYQLLFPSLLPYFKTKALKGKKRITYLECKV